MTSCIVTLVEQGQTLVAHNEVTQSVMGTHNDWDTCIGGSSRGDVEKTGQKADNVQSIEDRRFYETEEKKHQFVR